MPRYLTATVLPTPSAIPDTDTVGVAARRFLFFRTKWTTPVTSLTYLCACYVMAGTDRVCGATRGSDLLLSHRR